MTPTSRDEGGTPEPDDAEERLFRALFPQDNPERDGKLDDAPASELKDEDVEPEKRVRAYRDEIDAEELKRHRQANRLREALFWFGLVLASITVTTSAFIAIWGTVVSTALATPAMVAFVSGLSVQTIGILWVMARYLFSPPHRTRPEPEGEH